MARLSLQEAARMLGVSPQTLRRWARQGMLGIRRPEGEPTFHPSELEQWARSHGLHLRPRPAAPPVATLEPDGRTRGLFEALVAGGIQRDLAAISRGEALTLLVSRVALPERADPEDLLDQLRQREALSSTGLGHGVALPHPRTPSSAFVDRPLVLLGLFENPVDWQAIDGQPVHSAFLLLNPTPAGHLKILSRLAFLLRDDAFCGLLARKAADEEILQAVRKGEPGLP